MPLLLALLLLLGAPARERSTVRVTVRVLEVRSAKGGVIRAALHLAPGAGFPGPTPTGNIDVVPTAPETVVVFEVVPGRYAAALHHDANANGRMDTNLVGIPKEGYGVSNDARPRFRAPSFSDAEVRITRDTTLTVHMAY